MEKRDSLWNAVRRFLFSIDIISGGGDFSQVLYLYPASWNAG